MKNTIIVQKPTVLKLSNEPLPSDNLTNEQKLMGKVEDTFTVLEVLDHKDKHIRVKVEEVEQPIWVYLPHVMHDLPDDVFFILPLDKLTAFISNANLAKTYHEGINRALSEYNINTTARWQQFLAQVAHESGGFKWSEELASGRAYEGRKDLGNIYAGDGTRFKGRGLIQLTGRHNYNVAGKQLGLDLINRPQLASSPPHAPRIAGWYWNSRGLNTLADQNSIVGYREITKRINGGLNGWKDRLHWLDKARRTLK